MNAIEALCVLSTYGETDERRLTNEQKVAIDTASDIVTEMAERVISAGRHKRSTRLAATARDGNPATSNVPLVTPRDMLKALVRQTAIEHKVNYEDMFGLSMPTGQIMRAKYTAIQRVVDIRPSWSYSRAATFFKIDATTVADAMKCANRFDHTRAQEDAE